MAQRPAVSAPSSAVPGFGDLQLTRDCAAPPVMRIELRDLTVGTMTVDLSWDPATVLGLAQAFWRQG